MVHKIKAKLHAGNRFGLIKLLHSTTLSKNLKVQLLNFIFLRPIVKYGCEARTLRQLELVNLQNFERKIMKLIFNPCMDGNAR